MAAAFVQELGGTSGATAPATYSVTLPGPTTNGNLVVIVVASDATVATPAGFALDKSQVNSNGHYHWSKVTTGGETGWTVTPNSSAAGVWYAAEISGLAASPLDQTASTGASSGATTRSTGTTGTTAQADELAIASWGSSVVGTAATWGAQTNGYAERIADQVSTTGTSNIGLSVAALVLSATGTTESTATADGGQAPKSTGMVVTYKVAAGSSIDAAASLATTATVTATAGTTQPAGATPTATAGLTAAATVDRAASVALAATAGVAAGATLTAVAGGALTATTGVTAAATVDTSTGAGLAASVSITATADIPSASGVIPLDAAAVYAAAADHAAASGLFDRVIGHEPKSAPGRGLTAAFWLADLRPVPAESGLALTTYRLVLNVRIYNPMLQEPQDGIDLAILTAASALLVAYNGDFTLGGLVKDVDILGRAGEPLAGRAGYIEQDQKWYRAMVLTLPLILNDLAEQAP